MDRELTFRVIFASVYILSIGVRIYHYRKSKKGEKYRGRRKAGCW